MKLETSSFEIINQKDGLLGAYEHIENVGRTCYKSHAMIKHRWYTEDLQSYVDEGSEEWKSLVKPSEIYPIKGENISAKEFVDRLIKLDHLAMVEHATVYLIYEATNKYDKGFTSKYYRNPYSKVNFSTNKENGNTIYYITTNYRVLIENKWLEDLKYLSNPTEYHAIRITVKFICDIGVSREANRHRSNSIAEQSTRYCNYSNKTKFNSELCIIRPSELKEEDVNKTLKFWGLGDDRDALNNLCSCIISENEKDRDFTIIDIWLFANLATQWSYMELIKKGWSPQQARRVLPLDTQTELVHTAYIKDWKHFFKLRDAQSAHPQIRELAHGLHKEFKKMGVL